MGNMLIATVMPKCMYIFESHSGKYGSLITRCETTRHSSCLSVKVLDDTYHVVVYLY